MKEVEQKQQDTIEVVKQPEVKKLEKYLGSFRPKKGQRLYEVDLMHRTAIEASYKFENTVVYDPNTKAKKVAKKLVVKEHCIYIPAINLNNVVRKVWHRFGILIEV